MEKVKKSFIILLGVVLPLIFLHCTKYKESAPFFDGLFLEYKLGALRITYNVYVLDNNKFKIIETEKARVLSDDVEELFVDAYGRVYKSSFEDYEDGFSPIWIPANQMQIGDTFDDGYTVLREDSWKKWKVLVVKNPLIEEERYYDLNTGYWVGAFARTTRGTGEIILVDTNSGIPVVE